MSNTGAGQGSSNTGAASLPGEIPPTSVTPSEPVTSITQVPPEPQGPTLEDVLKVILKHQEETDKKLDSLKFNIDADHGKLLQHDSILQKVDGTLDKLLAGVQGAGVAQPGQQGGFKVGGIDLHEINELVKTFGIGGGETDPMNTLYNEIGKKVLTGSVDSAVKRIVKTLGGETASHVVVDSSH